MPDNLYRNKHLCLFELFGVIRFGGGMSRESCCRLIFIHFFFIEEALDLFFP